MIINKDEFLETVKEAENLLVTEDEVMERLTESRKNDEKFHMFKKSVLSEEIINKLKEAGYEVTDYTDDHMANKYEAIKVGWDNE